MAVHPIATADLAQVDNSTKLPLLLLGIVKDPEELADGHFPEDAPGAILEIPAVCAPITRAVDARSANSVAARRRHAIDTRPNPPDDTTEALTRQDAHALNQRTREAALAVAACESVEGKVALARDSTDGLAAQVAHLTD